MREWIYSTYGSRSVDFWTSLAASDGTIDSTYGSGDGIHINNAGHRKLYNRVVGSGFFEDAFVAPTISSVSSSVSTSTATITWATNELASSTVNYGTTISYGTSSTTDVLRTSHSVVLTGLSTSTTYHFRVASGDSSGNTATSSDYTFTTDAGPDVTAPTISSVASSTGATTATVTWTTDEAATSKVSYGTSSGNYTTSTSSASSVTSHSLGLTGLSSGTQYYFVVVSGDSSSNIATSSEYILTTTQTQTSTQGASSGGGSIIQNPLPFTASEQPVSRGASALSSTHVQAILSVLESFSVDSATINRVRAALAGPAVQTPASTNNRFPRDLEYGMVGEDVRALQKCLNAAAFLVSKNGPGSRGNETTRFGVLTQQALKRFQLAKGLPATGYFGSRTRALCAQ